MDQHKALEAVQQKLIAGLEKDGIERTFEWISAYFSELAEAKVRALVDTLPEHLRTNKEALQLVYETEYAENTHLLNATGNLFGANHLGAAYMAALGKRVRSGGHTKRNAAWTELTARFPEPKTDAAPASV